MTGNNISSNMVFFASIKDSVDALNLSDSLKVEYYEGVINYGLYGIDPNFSNPMLTAIFIALKPNIDANNRKKMMAIKCSENGKKGGGQKGNTNACKSKGGVKKTGKKTSPKTSIDKDMDSEVEVDSEVDDEVEVEKETKDTSFLSSSSKEQEQENEESVSTTDNSDTPRDDADTPDTSSALPANDLAARNERFYQSLVPHISTCGAETLQRFYDYWSEPNAEGTRMRFELEPTWNLDYRLERWMKKRDRLNL